MAWIYLAASEESLADSAHGSEQSPIVNKTDTHKVFCCPECNRVKLITLLSLPTCENCHQSTLPPCQTSSSADFPAKTSVLQELEKAWQESDQDFSLKSSDSLASFDRPSFSWKTYQQSLFGGLTEFSWSSLRSGMIRDGLLFQPQKLEPHTYERGGSCSPRNEDRSTEIESTSTTHNVRTVSDGRLYPTPKASDSNPCGAMAMLRYNERTGRKTLITEAVKRSMWPTPCARDWKGASSGFQAGKDLPGFVKRWPTPAAQDAKNSTLPPSQAGRDSIPGALLQSGQSPGGQLNPQWVEWLMGYPIGWTELSVSAMQWFQSKRGSRSKG